MTDASLQMRTQFQTLLSSYAERSEHPAGEHLQDLLGRCRAATDRNSAREAAPLRTIHHFACSGGTLISRVLAAQANVVLLSEIDPFSTMHLAPGQFWPTDVLGHRDIGVRGFDGDVVEDVFLESLESLHVHLRRTGRCLILRDHPHSHFCTDQDFDARPLLGDVLRSRFLLRSVVTVRHPLDSFLSLARRKWVHFEPQTLEEYARRYWRFLDCYATLPLFRYEDFVLDTDRTLQEMLDVLAMPLLPDWRDVLPGVVLSGDSGRSGVHITPRPRHDIPEQIVRQEEISPTYTALCERLKYNPDFAASPYN